MARRNVVIGLVGSTLDAGVGEKRWTRWRPSVAICQQADFRVDRFELLLQPQTRDLAAQVTADIAQVSPHTEVRLHELDLANPWDFSPVYAALDDFADAYAWRDTEDYYLHITTGTHVVQICLFLLCETRAMPAVLLQASPRRADRAGASGAAGAAAAPRDTIGRVDVIDLELEKFDRLAARFRARRASGASLLKAGIQTRNARFNAMIDELEHVASRSRDPLLLTGETGTGKTALCQRLHELKRIRQHLAGELVGVNCATLRGDLAMSVLFGHARGAFTGAAEARTGLLRKADRGLVFLDEIGELGRDEQAMLLTAIEERRFYPLGADKQVASEFQLVAGTNRDLAADVRAGRFREDLLARIALWTFRIPALRDRPEDIEPNLDYELARLSAELGVRVSFARPARDAFLRFAETAPWPGNFRDFNAALRRMATLADGGRIDAAGVAAEIARLTAATRAGAGAGAGAADDGLAALLGERAAELDRFDRVQLADVVAVCAAAPSLSAAGRTLFARSMAQRTTRNDADRLRKYLARFGLDFDQLRARA
ncbi:MAG TPA: RNA repair transcriptional activator RtcR [Kofleriaceae bacterium]|nr:RNA repair transcriptional activator RtcR [Kofleriaceae bacterium]